MRKCQCCGIETSGSTGAAGIFWPNVCQECKDRADNALKAQLQGQKMLFDKVMEVVNG